MQRINKPARSPEMKKIIGKVTTYHGDEHRYMKDYKVRIVAVLKNAAKPDIDVDGPDYAHLSDDDDIARAGGVGIHDRIEVQPWIEKEGRFSLDNRSLGISLDQG